jgi:hypothetical protein
MRSLDLSAETHEHDHRDRFLDDLDYCADILERAHGIDVDINTRAPMCRTSQ